MLTNKIRLTFDKRFGKKTMSEWLLTVSNKKELWV